MIFRNYILYVILVVFISSCANRQNHNGLNKVGINSYDTLMNPPIQIIDSTDIIIQRLVQQRKETSFTDSLPCGVVFGMSRAEYEKHMQKYKNEHGRTIYMTNAKNKVISGQYKMIYPKFFQDELYSLKVEIENEFNYDIFTEKYGTTKNATWTFDNVQIEVKYTVNKSTQDISGYPPANKNNMIYFTEDGRVTRKQVWSTITYTDITAAYHY